MNFLFIHGGPGLNSNPEKEILSHEFSTNGDTLYFWNEPSRTRGSQLESVTFEDSCESLKLQILSLKDLGSLTVIAHSFGAFVFNQILPEIEQYIEKIVLITPVFNLSYLDRNLIKRTALAYESIGDANSEVLKDYLGKFNPNQGFDEQRFNHILIAASYEKFNDAYWFQKDCMGAYYAHFNDLEYQFSMDNFKSIRSSCSVIESKNKTLIETVIFYGKHDPFILSQESELIKQIYPDSNIITMESSSHYPHIEESREFLDTILRPNLILDLSHSERHEFIEKHL
ncbi:MAG: alpha/beta fold hydrolase [Bacteriovoracaceae bacterium]